MRHLRQSSDLCHAMPLVRGKQALHLEVLAVFVRSHLPFGPLLDEAACRWWLRFGRLLFSLFAEGRIFLIDSRDSLSQAGELVFGVEQRRFAVCTPVYPTLCRAINAARKKPRAPGAPL